MSMIRKSPNGHLDANLRADLDKILSPLREAGLELAIYFPDESYEAAALLLTLLEQHRPDSKVQKTDNSKLGFHGLDSNGASRTQAESRIESNPWHSDQASKSIGSSEHSRIHPEPLKGASMSLIELLPNVLSLSRDDKLKLIESLRRDLAKPEALATNSATDEPSVAPDDEEEEIREEARVRAAVLAVGLRNAVRRMEGEP